MALGHTPVETRAIASRFKSLYLSIRDSRAPDAANFSVGSRAKLKKKFVNSLEDPFEMVTVLNTRGGAAVIQGEDRYPRWVSVRHLHPVNSDLVDDASVDVGEEPVAGDAVAGRLPVVSDEPSEPPIDPISNAVGDGLGLRWVSGETGQASEDKADAKYAPVVPRRPDDAPKHLPKKAKKAVVAVGELVPEETKPAVGDWIVLASGGKPWFGVLSAVERDDQLVVHSWSFARRGPKDSVVPIWSNDVHRTKHSKSCPRGWEPTKWRVTGSHLVYFEPRLADSYRLPSQVLQSIADYKRDPRKSK